MVLKINTDELVVFANKLERVRKSALPLAVKDALNNAAFDMKKDTLLDSAEAAFENRSKNFFKANSSVEMAQGWDINSMAATVGMTSDKLKGDSNYAVKDLEQQEFGGTIKKKAFIPIQTARKGNSNAALVRPNARLAAIKNIIDARKLPGKSDAQKFNYAMSKAEVGSKILANYKGKTILWMVNSLNKTKTGSHKLTPLYSYEEKRSVSVKATHFIEKAYEKSGAKLDMYFIKQAQRQIEKLM
jgi:hypothetical protein